MAGILLRRICEEYGKMAAAWSVCMLYMFIGLNDKPLADAILLGVIFLALIAAVIIAGISSEPLKGVFIAPFSKEDRKKLVTKIFYGKIAAGMAGLVIVITLAAVCGTITVVNWFTMFLIALSIVYMVSFKRIYAAYHPSMEALEYVFAIADLIIFIGACDNEFLFLGKSSGVVLLIISVILAVVHYFVWRRYFEPLVECYSEYEKVTELSRKIRSSSYGVK